LNIVESDESEEQSKRGKKESYIGGLSERTQDTCLILDVLVLGTVDRRAPAVVITCIQN
jgi:hypothetical protein